MNAAHLAKTGELAEAIAKSPREQLEALTDGVHYDVPDEVYHARSPGFVSKSALDLVARSPARYAAWLAGHERTETPALRFGRAMHMALLEPERFAKTYVVEPHFGDLRYKENKAKRDAWRQEYAGATVLDGAEGARALRMVAAVAGHPTARALLLDGRPEVTLIWRDQETGLRCKARLDYLLEDISIPADVKSTEDAREAGFARSIESFGYHKQAAHYIDGMRARGLDPDEDGFVLIPVEKEYPHDLAVYQVDAEDVAEGRRANRAAMRLLAECLETNNWPGYPAGMRTISRPAWARKKDL